MTKRQSHWALNALSQSRAKRIVLTFITSALAVPFMSLLVVTGFFAPLQMGLGPIHWCIYGKFEVCFLGELGWLSDLLSDSILVVVSACYVWLQWRLIWKK